LPNPDKVLEAKGGDVSVYRDLTYDSQVNSCIVSRESGVMSCEYRIVSEKDAAGLDSRAHGFITEQWNSLNMENLYRDILEAVWLGYSPIETILGRDGERIVYDALIGRPAEWFFFDTENNLRFRSENNPTDGDPVIVSGLNRQVELVQYRAGYRNPYGESELARCFWPVHFKKGDIRYWISFIERFGDDPVFINLPTRPADDEIDKYLDMLYEMKSSGAGVFWGESKPETLGVDKKASSDLFNEMVKFCDSSISKTLTGHSATADSTPGKLGNEDMAETVRGDIQDSDKRLISGVMNRMIRRLVDLNFTVSSYPKFEFFEEEDVQSIRAERDAKVFEMGWQPTEQYLQRVYDYQPGDLKEVIKPADLTTGLPASGGSEKKKSRDYRVEFADPEQKHLTIEDIVAQAEREAKEAEDLAEKGFGDFYGYFEDTVNEIENAVETSSDFNEAAGKIIEIGRLHAIRGIDGASPVVGVGNTTKVTAGASDFLARSLITMNALGRRQVIRQINEDGASADFADGDWDPKTGMMEYSGAKKFLSSKLAMSDAEFKLLSDEQKNYAFAVTGISKAETAQGILDKLAKALDEGQTYEQFKSGIDPKLLAINDLRLSYLQNLQTAYMSGRYGQMKASAEFLPYWMYVTVGDDRVRPGHAAMHGIVRRHDDPFWSIWYPPNGFRCRCFVRALTAGQVKAMGITVGKGIPSFSQQFGTQTEMGNVPGNIDPAAPMMPDDGFAHNPAEVKSDAWIQKKLADLKELRPDAKGARIPFETKNWQELGLKSFKDQGYKTEMKLGKYDAKTGEKMLAEKLADKAFIQDALGKPVFINPKQFISHIDKDKERMSLLDGLENVLTDPDEIWMNIHYLTADKQTVLSYEYIKMINGKAVELVVQQYGGIPSGWTIYPNRSIDNNRMGYLIFKKGAKEKIKSV
jgi:SPP1 gp7 family putative phage head morphogenesis protein